MLEGGGGGGERNQYETQSSNTCTVELVERITILLFKLKSDFRKKVPGHFKKGAEGVVSPLK